MIYDRICYTKWEQGEISRFSQCNSKLLLPRRKQGNYLAMTIYGANIINLTKITYKFIIANPKPQVKNDQHPFVLCMDLSIQH